MLITLLDGTVRNVDPVLGRKCIKLGTAVLKSDNKSEPEQKKRTKKEKE